MRSTKAKTCLQPDCAPGSRQYRDLLINTLQRHEVVFVEYIIDCCRQPYLTEVSKRDLDNLEIIDRQTFLRTMSQVCRDLGYRDEAFEWIRKAREEVGATDDFEGKLNWAMREFQFRVENRSDEALPGLIDELWNYFGGKLPEIRNAMEPILKELSLPIPGETASGIVLSESAASSSASGESKLWLPD